MPHLPLRAIDNIAPDKVLFLDDRLPAIPGRQQGSRLENAKPPARGPEKGLFHDDL